MLLARFKTAVVAVLALLIVLFWLPPVVIAPVVLLLMLGAAWEWSALIGFQSIPSRGAYAALIGFGCVLLWPGLLNVPVRPLLAVTACWWLYALVLVLRYPRPASKLLVFVAGIMSLVPAFFALVALSRYPTTGAINGPALLLFVLATIFGTDVGGYFAGRFLGKRKLAPSVSPKKTWAGVGGGLVVAALVGFIGSTVFNLAWFRLVPLCLIIAAISILGDLTVSLFKREAGIKDSGVLFPGHGGILDRIDSIAAASPFFVAGIVMGHGPW